LNLDLKPGTRFSHAWSLCVEEQFYFALPIVAVLVARLRGAVALAWLLLAAGFIAGMALRAHGWDAARPPAWGNSAFYTEVYYYTLCRSDELLAGVALALVRQCDAPLWARITGYGNWTLALGTGITALAFKLFLDDHFGRAVTVFGYPLLALGFGLLVLAALSPGSVLARVRVPGAASIAVWSYAIYLTHKQLCILLARSGIDAQAPLGIAVMAGASVLAGWLLYRLVETPFMWARERWVPPVATPRVLAAQAA
jgi:peptidoglycan/LPS O-acetylase OafA/YrhL